MKTTTINLTSRQLDQFLARVRATPASPVGEHLDDAEFLGYRLGMLGSEEIKQINEHLASCSDCAAEMEDLLQESKAWRSKETKERLAGIKQKLREQFVHETAPDVVPRKIDLVASFLAWFRDQVVPEINPFLLKEQRCGTKPKPAEVKTKDGKFGAYLYVLDNGDLSISVRCSGTSLENQSACIMAGEKRWVATFRKVQIRGQDQVVAELVVKHEELLTLPQGSVLRAEFPC